jgi:hypothetical protein
MNANQPPTIACALGAEDQSARASRWARLRATAEVARTPTGDGIRLAFRDDRETETELRTLVELENECCAWARWTVARQKGALVLDASSSRDGVEALQAMFGPAPGARSARARA